MVWSLTIVSVTVVTALLAISSRTNGQASSSPLAIVSSADSSNDLTASANDIVNLTCVALRTAKVLWYFTDQHLPILSYAGDSKPPVLFTSGQIYTPLPLGVVNVSGNADQYWAIALTVRVSDQSYGHYQCQASDGSLATPQIHDVYVRINGLSTITFNQSAYSTCCLASSIKETCKVFCEPWKLLNMSDVLSTMILCLSDLNARVASCGLGINNVARCCARREVPNPCLPMCRLLPASVGGNGAEPVCLNSTILSDIFTCHSEGVVSVPGPPISITATLEVDKRSISVKWSEPVANPQLVRGYSVHWKAETDAYFFSNVKMSILVGTTITLPATGGIAPSYAVYVQSIGDYGTSIPSPTVTTVGPAIPPNASVTPVMRCCIESMLTARCASLLCSGRPILDLNEIINSSCGKHLTDVFGCYAGGRNHTSCCLSENVPSTCGKFCTGEKPHVTVEDTSICLPHLDAIARCYDSGAAGIPSPPRLLSLDGITDRSVSVHWLAPLYGAELVRNYSLLVIDKVTGWRTAVSTKITEYTVQGLVSDRFYELATVAVGDAGTSLPSNRMTVMTMDSPPSSQQPGGNSGQPDFIQCCSQLLVPANCTAYCAANFNPSTLPEFCRRAALPALLACLVDGRNNTPCCKANGVPTGCLPACEARPGDVSPPDYCITVLSTVQTCALAAYASVPSEPTHLTVQSYGTNFVDLGWQQPARRPTGAQFRYFLYADIEQSGTIKSQVNVTQFPADSVVGHVVNLNPGGRYTFQIAAVSDAGSSLFSDPVSVWLLPELPYNWSAANNASHLPYGISLCCQAKKVPVHCQLLCDPRNMTNWNHTDSTLSTIYTNCTASLPDISSCLADGKNHEVCCKRENVPDSCLGLCSGSPVPAGSLTCPLWWREVYDCIEEGILSVPSPPIIRRADVFSSRLLVIFDRNTADATARSILYIRYADVPSHWYAFLNPNNPAVFRVPSNTSFSLFMLNSNTNGSSQPTPVYTLRTNPEHPLNMYITTNTSSFRILEGSATVALTCYYNWDYPADPTYLWYRSGELLQFSSTPSYIIPHAEARDSGLYTCAVRLSTGQAGSVSVSLHIQSPTRAAAVTGIVPATPTPKESVRLTCAFEGFPDSVVWLDPSGLPIVSSGDGAVRVPMPSISDLLTYSSVEFTGITQSQFGLYTCNGTNLLGSHSAGIRLYNVADDSRTSPAPPTAGPLPTPAGKSRSVACCSSRRVSTACLALCDAATATGAAASDPQCGQVFANDATHCIADSRNYTKCCAATRAIPAGCLPLCWGDPPAPAPAPACSLTPAISSAVVSCLSRQGVPGPPLAVTVAAVSPNRLAIAWQPPVSGPEYVAGYLIVVRLTSGSSVGTQRIEKTVGPTITQYVLSPVPASAAVTVTVTSLGDNTVGDSLASNPASAATPGTPQTPSNLHVVTAGNNIAMVAWVSIPGATLPDGFQVNASLAGRSLSLRVPAGQTQAALRCLLPRSDYAIRVRALNSDWGDSPFTEPPLRVKTGMEDPSCRGTNYDYWLQGSRGDGPSSAGTVVLAIILVLACLSLAFTVLVFYWRRTGVPSSVRSRMPCIVDIVDGDCCRCCDRNRMAGYVANNGGGGGGDGGGGGSSAYGPAEQLFDNPVRFDNSDGLVRFGREGVSSDA